MRLMTRSPKATAAFISLVVLILLATVVVALQSSRSFANEGTGPLTAEQAARYPVALPTIDTVVLKADGTLAVWTPEKVSKEK